MEGDSQVEEAHGGVFKALYAYSTNGYAYWNRELDRESIPQGAFGENLTVSEMADVEICSGDRFTLGEAELIATTPRIPCNKLEIRLQQRGLVERFLRSPWPGVYFMVSKPGRIRTGELLERKVSAKGPSIVDLVKLYTQEEANPERYRQAIQLESIPPEWKARLARSLQRLTGLDS